MWLGYISCLWHAKVGQNRADFEILKCISTSLAYSSALETKFKILSSTFLQLEPLYIMAGNKLLPVYTSGL